MSYSFYRVASSFLLAAALIAQEPSVSTFRSASTLVLVPFNVERDKRFITQVQSSDFILREDGHPRAFTVFEGPGTEHQLPVELVLLFDTSSPPLRIPHVTIEHVWDAKSQYEFLDGWDESTTRMILQENGTGVRMSVYHFADDQLERLCSATGTPQEIVSAFHRLLDPIPAGVNKLELLPGDHVPQMDIWGSTGWWKEATVATLKDAAASAFDARHIVLLFSDLSFINGTGVDHWQDIVDNALALGIPVDPVILDPVAVLAGSGSYVLPFSGHLGEMSGGKAFAPQHLNRDALASILAEARNTMLSRYYVGFVPETSAKARKHTLKVELKSKTTGKLIGGARDGVVY